jgi:hypothetical protein
MTEDLSGCGDDDLVDEHVEVRYLHPQPTRSSEYDYNALASRLVGYRLQSVQFLGGYLQLGFESVDGTESPVLTCEVMPVVVLPAGNVADGQLGYADALRSLIGDCVARTSEARDDGLCIEFGGGALRLRPTTAQLVGPVIAMLSDFADGSSMSWRPGGPTFEYLD